MSSSTLVRLSRGSDSREFARRLEADGAVIVEDFITQGQADKLSTDFASHLDAVDWGNSDTGVPDGFHGLQTKRLHGLLARSTAFGELVVDPLLATLCDRILRPQCREVRISTGELMHLAPGQEQQVLHRDADSWLYHPRPRPEILLSANVALTDFTAENGATVVVPGSHRWSADRKAEPGDETSVVMPRGAALLYSGDVLHGGGANHSHEQRTGLYFGFVLSWLRPLENHLQTNGAAALEKAPPAIQRLLGYTKSGFEVVP
jgi:hypothetical protein